MFARSAFIAYRLSLAPRTYFLSGVTAFLSWGRPLIPHSLFLHNHHHRSRCQNSPPRRPQHPPHTKRPPPGPTSALIQPAEGPSLVSSTRYVYCALPDSYLTEGPVDAPYQDPHRRKAVCVHLPPLREALQSLRRAHPPFAHTQQRPPPSPLQEVCSRSQGRQQEP